MFLIKKKKKDFFLKKLTLRLHFEVSQEVNLKKSKKKNVNKRS
jgi:hypothetical protein